MDANEPAGPQPLFEDNEKMTGLGTATKLISLKVCDSRRLNKPVVTPIYHTATYYAESCRGFDNQIRAGYIYHRERNPNADEVEMTIAQIEHGKATVMFPSGMAAIFSTLMCFLKPGDHVVAHSPMYNCAVYFLTNMLKQYQVEVTLVDADEDVDEYRKAVKDNTRILYGEALTNPMMSFLDVKKLADIGKELNIMTVVDATFTPPTNHTPLDYGIDVVIHSCTKYLGGHSDIIAGCVTVNNLEYNDKLRTWRSHSGSNQSSFDSVLLLRSLKTLHVRMDRHNQNGMAVAEYLDKHPMIKKVRYIGLPSHPQHSIAASMLKGFGGMMGVELETQDKAIKFAESTKIFKFATSLGGVESLIEHIGTMTVMECEGRYGIPYTLVRLSVGIEDVNDLIADLKSALEAVETVST